MKRSTLSLVVTACSGASCAFALVDHHWMAALAWFTASLLAVQLWARDLEVGE